MLKFDKFKFVKSLPKPVQKFFKNASKGFDKFKLHVYEHWPRYALSLITGTFTFHAAFIISGQAYYGVIAVMLSEGMFLYWFNRLEVFENFIQATIALVMWTLGGVSILFTDIASAIMIANGNDVSALSQYMPFLKDVSVKQYITNIIPLLAAVNLIAYGLFEFFSERNKEKRYNESQQRQTRRYIRNAELRLQRMRAQSRVLKREKEITKMQEQQRKKYGKEAFMRATAKRASLFEQIVQKMYDFVAPKKQEEPKDAPKKRGPKAKQK